MQNDVTLDDGAPAPGLSALARLKLSRELATVKTDITAIAAGPMAALTRLKLVARANQIRAQLGGVAPPVAVESIKAFEIGGVRFEPIKQPDPRRAGHFYWAALLVETGAVLEDVQKESAAKLEDRYRDDFERGLKCDSARWRAGFGLPPMDAPAPVVAEEAPEVAELREVVAGQHDGLGLGGLLAKIEKAVSAIFGTGSLLGDTETLANDAVTHWARLELQTNG